MQKTTFSFEALSTLCLELSSLLHAGVTEADALALLAEDEEDSQLQKRLAAAARRMDDGVSLSTALREECALPVYLCGLLEVGAHSGHTEEALSALAEYYEQQQAAAQRLRTTLLYPVMLLVVMLLVIGVLLIKVLPLFDDVYATLGGRLTGIAGGLLALGQGLHAALPVLGVLLCVGIVCVLAVSVSERLCHRVTTARRRRFGDCGVLKKMNNAKIVQAMAMAMCSGIPAEDALRLAVPLVEDIPPAAARCLQCRTLMDNGTSITEALCKSGILRSAQGRLLQISGRSGTDDMAMTRIARTMAEDAQAELEDTVGRIEPALVMFCSVLVGIILLSVMLPLMHIMTAIG